MAPFHSLVLRRREENIVFAAVVFWSDWGDVKQSNGKIEENEPVKMRFSGNLCAKSWVNQFTKFWKKS